MTQPVPSDASAQPEPPIRTCVGCRTRDDLPDTAGTMPGRGAWIHPSEACVAALEKKNGLARAFKRAVPAAALKACCEQIRAVLTARESSPEAAPGTV